MTVYNGNLYTNMMVFSERIEARGLDIDPTLPHQINV